ncbi:MAG: hypothetical protein ACKPKO_16045, partial [Candidatus Fonsibacter sp.]
MSLCQTETKVVDSLGQASLCQLSPSSCLVQHTNHIEIVDDLEVEVIEHLMITHWLQLIVVVSGVGYASW